MPPIQRPRLAAWLQRLTGARLTTPPRVIRPWREDAAPSYPTLGLTPSRVRALLQAADQGRPREQFELFTEMLQKWPRLAAVENTRRLALTGLDWEIAADATAPPAAATALAEAAADHCRATLAALRAFRHTLDFLASAIGFGVSVAELVWEAGRLVDVVPVPYTRLQADRDEPWRLRVLTEDRPHDGVALDHDPHKWLIHQPRLAPGRPFRGGMLRASALLYVAQNLSLKDWLVYSQIAGMPLRIAQFEPGVSEEDQRKLLQMLESLGTDAVATLSKDVELKFVETGRAHHRQYQQFQDFCNTEVTILWLGQHLTTDIRQSGSRAAAEIHDRVREDLLVDDISDEATTLRRDLLTPIVRARFGDAAPVPHFRRSLMQSVDTRVLAETLAIAVQEIGLRVPQRWAHRALGIPEPQHNEPILRTGAAQ